MKLGVISRIIGVPPTGPKATLALVSVHEEDVDNTFTPPAEPNLLGALPGDVVKLGENHHVFVKFTSDMPGTLIVIGLTSGSWTLVDGTTFNAIEGGEIVAGTNWVRFDELSSGTYNVELKVKALQGWYYTMSDALAVPEFTVIGYLLTTFPAAVGYSLSKIEASATRAIQISRSSDGYTTTMDIGFVGDDLDTVAMSAWVGTGATDHAVVNIVYNQVFGLNAENDPAIGHHLLPTNIIPKYLNSRNIAAECDASFPGMGAATQWKPFIVLNGIVETMSFNGTKPCIRCEGFYYPYYMGGSGGASDIGDSGRQMYVANPSPIFSDITEIMVGGLIRTHRYYKTIRSQAIVRQFKSITTSVCGLRTDLGLTYGIYHKDVNAFAISANNLYAAASVYQPSAVFGTWTRTPAQLYTDRDSQSGRMKFVSTMDIVNGNATWKGKSTINNVTYTEDSLPITPAASMGPNANGFFIPGNRINSITVVQRNAMNMSWHTFVVYTDNNLFNVRSIIFDSIGN